MARGSPGTETTTNARAEAEGVAAVARVVKVAKVAKVANGTKSSPMMRSLT